MPIKNPKELFVTLLSDVRQNTERSAKLYQEIGQAAQEPEIKEALESRAWITEKDLSSDRPVLPADRRETSEAERASAGSVC